MILIEIIIDSNECLIEIHIHTSTHTVYFTAKEIQISEVSVYKHLIYSHWQNLSITIEISLRYKN